MPPKTNIRLHQKLPLLSWLHNCLGYDSTTGLLEDLRDVNEGFDEDEQSYICGHLRARSEQFRGITITSDDLRSYDDNIRNHLNDMNDGRLERITLRYFQYLAALYTEIYLDHLCNRREQFLLLLNQFVDQQNPTRPGNVKYEHFEDDDLDKLAFWMATGSGKTLLFHINYQQYLHYAKESLDNILLITPNEGLSQQHIDEMRASGIAAARFNLNDAVGLNGNGPAVKVTEITKLVLEKRGEGDSIPVEALEGKNLIFVDEGHKGSGGKAWRDVRERLGETGFTFEYSATFGQALAAARNNDLLDEYAKAIVFDYSYPHFYGDGYGKAFNVLNVRQESTAGFTDDLLLANLLSFYEQQLAYAERVNDLQEYNIEKPLWIFVGNTVQQKENDNYRSDVLTVVRFLQRFLSDQTWAVEGIGKLLDGEFGLVSTDNGQDLFANRFRYLAGHNAGAVAVYRDVLSRVMHEGSGGLQLCDLRAEGELGLRAAGSDRYFGVIYIGDTGRFKNLVRSSELDIDVQDNAFQESLFGRINEPDSDTKILVGSRKFMEGWSSWRVSSMGLLNIGRGEGSQIIQLFGRGVRLKGRGMSLKRSTPSTVDKHPPGLDVLENLNIFALKADYMAQFQEFLGNEGIATQQTRRWQLPIKLNDDFLNQGLVIPRLEDGVKYAGQESLSLEFDETIPPVTVRMAAAVQEIAGGSGDIEHTEATTSTDSAVIPNESLYLVDWTEVHLALLEYKEAKGYANLLIRKDAIRRILEHRDKAYELFIEDEALHPRNRSERQRLQQTVVNILRGYADLLYRRRQARWESQSVTYRKLDKSDGNLSFRIGEPGPGEYTIVAEWGDEELAEQIDQLITDCQAIHAQKEQDPAALRIHFDRHLYQPLLLQAAGLTLSPQGLNEHERRFVQDLKHYCAETTNGMPDGAELFLLRNQSRGTGVGFFESDGFYPDFILWIKTGDSQRIVFVEPHGMGFAKAYDRNQKARLYERLETMTKDLAKRTGFKNVRLDSFIVSTTSYQELKPNYGDGHWSKKEFKDKHILFQERGTEYDYMSLLLRQST